MRLTLAIILATLFPSLVFAEYNDFVALEMGEYKVEVQTPPWSYAGFHHLHTEQFQASQATPSGGEFHLTEFIPKGETFGEQGEMYGGWSRLYAVALETDVQQTAEEILVGQLAIYYHACENMDWQISNTTGENDRVAMVYCYAFKESPDVGEISFFYINVENERMLKNYYHIRTPRIEKANFPSGEAGDLATDALNDMFKMMLMYQPPRVN